MAETVVIARRFNGPPKSANGGYTCGLLARELGDCAEVSLRVPPPLDRRLAVERREDGTVALLDGETVVADGRRAELDLDAPPAVALEDAEAAVPGYEGFRRHPYPTCFACGPLREAGDGLRLFPGPVGRADLVACPWIPDSSLAAEDEQVRPEFVWAALDCPTAQACDLDGPAVLARLTARLATPLEAGQPHVVAAWRLDRDGRKHHAGSAIYSADGELLAISRALWIELKDPSAVGARI